MTPARPTPIFLTSLAGLAAPVLVALLAAVPVLVPVPPAVMLERTAASNVWPSVGSATAPLTSHTSDVKPGHSGAERDGVYADFLTPVGVRVAHWLFRLEKSGETGVGLPERG